MPIYSYRCNKCGENFDKLVRPGGNGSVLCTKCQSDASRVFSPVGIIFKGSGFYSTDYKSGSSSTKNASPDAGSENKAKEEKKPETGKTNKEKTAEKAKS